MLDARVLTSRSSGAVGRGALAPHFVAERMNLVCPTVLDFGAGPNCIHKPMLEGRGMVVDCYDLHHTLQHITYEEAKTKSYSCILASNVLNVQSTYQELDSTIRIIRSLMGNKTILVFNYPAAPRKLPISTEELLRSLPYMFGGSIPCKHKFRSGHVYTIGRGNDESI